jgi:hypothetical protein
VNAVGKPDEGKPHVRFDVAGGEDQGTGRPVLQASLLDPTNWPAQRHAACAGSAELDGRVLQRKRRAHGRANEIRCCADKGEQC